MNGVPPNLLRSDEEVAQIRQQRAEQMAQQQQMAMMGQMAGLVGQGAGAAADLAKAMPMEGEGNVGA
jgi:glycerol dehydrogenase-like iron-containing ADH family enzyme